MAMKITGKWDKWWRKPGGLVLGTMLLFSGVTAAGPIWDPGDLPAAVRMVLAEAGALMDKAQYDAAIEKLRAFEARGRASTSNGAVHPVYAHPMIHFALGNAYLLQEAYIPARQAFEYAVARHPDWVPAWLNLAKAHYELDAPAEAARCFLTAYEKGDGRNPEHLYLSAAAHLMAREYSASVVLFEQLLEHHPDQIVPEWREHMVHALFSDGRRRQALPHIRLLARTHEGDKRVQWQEILLHQYMHLEMHADALKLVRTLVEEAPAQAKWWKAKAHLHLNAQDFEPALIAMIVYGYLTPLSREERLLVADLHLQVGIPGRAAPLYEELLQRGDEDTHVLQNLVTALHRMGRLDAAHPAFRRLNERQLPIN
jgi:tetratricopeptide (TPR) repeat protein